MNTLFDPTQNMKVVLDKLENDYPQIVHDHAKLEIVKETHAPRVILDENQKRLDTRIAREFAGFELAIERIIESNDFVDIITLEKIIQKSRSVCRILKNNRPDGTGFLITGNIILTNNHVIASEKDCKNFTVQFNYEFDLDGKILNPQEFRLDPDTFFLTSTLKKNPEDSNSGLDFTMVAVEPVNSNGDLISAIPAIDLDGNIGKIFKGESCIIIQHPNGLPKKTTLNNNSFFSENDDQIIYETDTLPGSSGSMVLGLGTCEVIALHQTGVPRMDAQGNPLTKSGSIANAATPEEEIDWIGNAGMRISRIMDVLKSSKFEDPAKTKLKNAILARSKKEKKVLNDIVKTQPKTPALIADGIKEKVEEISAPKKPEAELLPESGTSRFLVTMKYEPDIYDRVEKELQLNFGNDFTLYLAMPTTAKEGNQEIFTLSIDIGDRNPNEFARDLLAVPDIEYAEFDSELLTNNDVTDISEKEALESFTSGSDKSTETHFLELYGKKSTYVKNQLPQNFRQWNWKAVNYKGNVTDNIGDSIKLVQLDTGYAHHPKIVGSFNLMQDFDFVDGDDNAREETGGMHLLAGYGHGARTGSLLVGNELADLSNNGNAGILAQNNVKLIPFRIAKDVLLINRQSELLKAVDRAISIGAKVITTSMGLPPTMTTYMLAKKVYQHGIIWCCAAGNEVGEVVAPAVHPGTIAVAASNPLDSEWKGSCCGKTVDITAPGMHVFVPSFTKQKSGMYDYGMAYGHGTSYATPHVAAAAVLWLHQNREKLKNLRGYQIVEAFRKNLKDSARTKHSLPADNFGAGILDIDQLLKADIPKNSVLKNAYANENIDEVNMAFRTVGESLKMIWNGILRKYNTTFRGQESLGSYTEMSAHAKGILEGRIEEQGISTSVESMEQTDQLEVFNQLRNLVIQ